MKKLVWLAVLGLALLTGCGSGGSGGNAVNLNASPTSSAIAVYKFDEMTGGSVANSANSYFTGSIYGASRVPGKVGEALKFENANARIEIPVFTYTPGSPVGITFAGDLVTVEAWVNADSAAAGTTSHIFGNGTGGTQSFRVQLNGSKVEFQLADNTGYTSIITSNQSLDTNTWYHIAVTYDGTTAKVYVNGVEDNRRNITFKIQTVINNLYIGSRQDGGGSLFHGTIDEVRLYNAVLSADEIKSYYDSTK